MVGEIGPQTDWTGVLRKVDLVVHLAARVQGMRGCRAGLLADFRRVNVQGTIALGRAAAAARVKRLVFLSTVKIHGEASVQPFRETDAARPSDVYALSKWEAEQALAQLAAQTELEYVILRPPLVYGPGVRANFGRLMQAVARGVPMPLARACNRRSLVYVGNLVDAIRVCLTHPAAANRGYLVADGEDLSTADLVRRLGTAMGVRARLWAVPIAWLQLAAAVCGRHATTDRLLGSLQVDSTALCRDTGWRPPFSVAEGLARTVCALRSAPR